jgi:hypothetical protein
MSTHFSSANASGFDRHEPAFYVVHPVAPQVYSCLTPFLFQDKYPLQNRSLIVHLPAAATGTTTRGRLVIINPAELHPEFLAGVRRLEAELDAEVTHLISPGDWHYLFMGQHLAAFPRATAFVPPGRIPEINPGFAYSLIDVAADLPFPELAPHLVALSCKGLLDTLDPEGQRPRYELLFHLPAAGAITSGDVLYYVGGELSSGQKAIGQRAGVVDFHFWKWKMVKDASALAHSLRLALAWDFDRYISIHGGLGNMLEHGAKADLARLLAWVEAGPA